MDNLPELYSQYSPLLGQSDLIQLHGTIQELEKLKGEQEGN